MKHGAGERQNVSRRELQLRYNAGGMAKNRRPALQVACGRSPAAFQALLQQFIGGWAVVPHGDTEDRAHSRGVEHEVFAIGGAKQHVVGVFVLNNDIFGRNFRIMLERPTHRLIETLERSSLGEQMFP